MTPASILQFFRRLPIFRRAVSPPKRELGDRGEAEAAAFFKNRGYRLLARNWRSGRDELDLVALDPESETLVFIEVKTRDESDPKGGYFAVDARKKRALKRAARAYLRALERPPAHIRFDIAEVRVGGSGLNGKIAMRVIHHCSVPLFHK